MPFPPEVDLILSEFFTMSCAFWVALYSMAHNFTELSISLPHNKVVGHEWAISLYPGRIRHVSRLLYVTRKIKRVLREHLSCLWAHWVYLGETIIFLRFKRTEKREIKGDKKKGKLAEYLTRLQITFFFSSQQYSRFASCLYLRLRTRNLAFCWMSLWVLTTKTMLLTIWFYKNKVTSFCSC